MPRFFVGVRVFCAVLAIFYAAPAARPAPVPKGADKKLAIAYVYYEDKAGAESFRKFLDAEGLPVELVAHGAVAKTDFGKYGLVVVGSDTESVGAWGDAATTIDRSGKPVLGLGEGGYAFLGMYGLKLEIGAPHGWHGQQADVVPIDPDKSPLWKAANVPANKALTLYKETGNVGIHLPKPPAGVVLLGREGNDATHYSIVGQGRCVLWGFTGGPDAMTADGQKVFVAACRYTAALAKAEK